MKILRLFLVASFIISLLAGFLAGTFIFHGRSTPHKDIAPTPHISSTPGKQDGIWLIAVDRINVSNPRIKGVWLLAYITNYVKLKPLPIFPSDNPQHDAELASVFRFTEDQQITPAFWDYLQKHGQTVKNYIIFDDIAAAEIISFFGGVTLQGKHLSALDVLYQAQDHGNDPQSSINRQIGIMDSLCKSIFNSQPVPDLYQLQRKIENHILSNLDLSEKSKEWQKLILNGDHKICDFSDLGEKPPISSKP